MLETPTSSWIDSDAFDGLLHRDIHVCFTDQRIDPATQRPMTATRNVVLTCVVTAIRPERETPPAPIRTPQEPSKREAEIMTKFGFATTIATAATAAFIGLAAPALPPPPAPATPRTPSARCRTRVTR